MPLALRFGSLDSSRNSYLADVHTAAKLVERRAGERATAWCRFREAARCSLAPAVTARLMCFLLRTVVR